MSYQHKDLCNKVTELNRINNNLKTELMRFDLIVKCYEKLIVILDKFRDNNSFNINYDLNERNEELLLRQKLISLKNLKLNNDLENNDQNIQNIEDQNESQCELSLINAESENADIIPKKEIEYKNTSEYDSDKSIPDEKPKKKKKTNKKDKKEYKCDVIGCEDKVFKSEFFLNRHKLIHNPKDCARKRFVCDFKDCGQRFTDNYKLNRHKVSHSDVKPFKCHYKGCGVRFKRKDKLNEHEKRHKNNSGAIDSDEELNTLIPETILQEGDQISGKVTNTDCNNEELRNAFSYLDQKETEKLNEKVTEEEFMFDYSVIPENMVEKPDYLFEKINDKFKCQYTGCMFETKQLLNFQKHYVKHLPNADNYKRYKCEFVGCGLKFFDKYRLKRHQLIHNSETPYKCDRIGCEYKAKRPDLLKDHKERHANTDEESMLNIFEGNLARNKNPRFRFVCDFEECKKTYFRKRSLALHKKIHKAKPEDFTVCGINGCERKFNLLITGINTIIESHQIDRHPEMFPGIEYKTCNQKDCEFKTKSIKQLSVHMKAHKKDETYVCTHENCDKKFTDGYKYRTHMKVHMGFRFICDIENCGKKFLCDSSLSKHKKTHREKDIACVWVGCEAKFYCDYQLKDHLNVHTGEKPNLCSWPGCGKRFHTKNNLSCHQRLHNDKKLFCDWPECGFRTNKRSRLTQHYDTHTGEKKYVCEWPGCGFATVYNENLVQHQRRLHKMDK